MKKTLFVVVLVLALLVASVALAVQTVRSADGNWSYVEMEDGTVHIYCYNGNNND